MRVLIAGIDGYLGWALAQTLAEAGHEVAGIDAFFRRGWVEEMGSWSAIPIASFDQRQRAFAARFGRDLIFREGDLTDWDTVRGAVEEIRPDAIVHLGECPSAPYSMIDVSRATWVQTNNLVGTLNLLYAIRDIAPETHLLKLGTMGEYGTPNVDIPEGFFEIEFRGRKDTLPFPRQAGSWYHWSKVHDSNNILFACRTWGLRSTDVMQGVVYGTHWDACGDDPAFATRLDFDQAFGTAINRFCCQAVIGEPLTLYGSGGQTRGFLPLEDSMRCLMLALTSPPAISQYRVFNQFAATYSIADLAIIVERKAAERGLSPRIIHLPNPRIEAERHHYQVDNQNLRDLGYEPDLDLERHVGQMLDSLQPHAERIRERRAALTPDILWAKRLARTPVATS